MFKSFFFANINTKKSWKWVIDLFIWNLQTYWYIRKWWTCASTEN